jgi:hypothetical protein
MLAASAAPSPLIDPWAIEMAPDVSRTVPVTHLNKKALARNRSVVRSGSRKNLALSEALRHES